MNSSTSKLLIAIDGPAGAGKSTIARLLAAELGIPYLNTGAMYRALALFSLENNIPLEEKALVQALAECELDLKVDGEATKVFLGARDVTESVRRNAVGEQASKLSVFPRVRAEMVARQQQLGRNLGGVIEGRDIGTVVFPEAPCKFFITASVAERASRRYRELVSLGQSPDIQQIQEEVEARDRRDTERETAPLCIAPGAVLIDTTGKDTSVVLALLLQYIDTLK